MDVCGWNMSALFTMGSLNNSIPPGSCHCEEKAGPSTFLRKAVRMTNFAGAAYLTFNDIEGEAGQ